MPVVPLPVPNDVTIRVLPLRFNLPPIVIKPSVYVVTLITDEFAVFVNKPAPPVPSCVTMATIVPQFCEADINGFVVVVVPKEVVRAKYGCVPVVVRFNICKDPPNLLNVNIVPTFVAVISGKVIVIAEVVFIEKV